MSRLRGLLSLVLSAVAATASGTEEAMADVIALGERRELFVDRTLIATMDGLSLRLHKPDRAGVALAFDRPWEGQFSMYGTVIFDDGLYRLYYRGQPRSGPENAVTCYAESHDGITWQRPQLGLHEVEGTSQNNVILAGQPDFSENFTPFLDERPGVAPEERFKALAGNAETGLVAFVSADGIRWRRWREEPVFRDGMFDSQNVAFWSASEGRYVCYFRTWTGPDYTGFRTISRTTSPDFIHWSEGQEMDFGDTPREQLYTNGTRPYFRAPHLYIALAKRFFPERAAVDPAIAAALVDNPGYRVASSDSVLMSTRGGQRYDRTFMEAFIRPGPAMRDWVSRDNTPAVGVVPGNEREIFLYRFSHYAQPSAHLMRYRQRIDGFASVHADYEGGEFITPPFTFSGDVLELNFASSAAGEIRCELQDADGRPYDGFSLDDCLPLRGDTVAGRVAWTGDRDLGSLASRPIRMRIQMRDADLYALRFFTD